jgi:diguanylate cyclase (GGDEF)-like protein
MISFFSSNKAIREAGLLVLLGIVLWMVAVRYNAYEQFQAFVALHEDEQIDELVVAFAITGALGLFYALARLIELGKQVQRRKHAEQEVRWIAGHDALTRLANRRGLSDAIKALNSDPDTARAVYSIDLDGFKKLNDLLGHDAGDEALVEVASRLRALFPNDQIFRLGGDEFLLVAAETDPTRVQIDADRIIKRLSEPYRVSGSTAELGASIGVALYPRHAADMEAAIRCADLAMYEGKHGEKGRVVWYLTEMNAEAVRRSEMETCLRRALKADAIDPYFQPLVDLTTGDLRGFEALARWQFDDGTFIPPVEFIPLAEDSGLIVELSEQILRKACTEAARWPAHLQLAVNISPVQLADRSLGARIVKILDETGFPASRLEIEVTESALVKDIALAELTLADLQTLGIRIALDDFGTGYSSLSQLSKFQFDKLKIDRSFVANFENDEKQEKIIRAMLGLGHGLGIRTTVEGIETDSQAHALKAIGCDLGQGYLYGKPMPAEAARSLIADLDRKSA